ncbi:hypothetical protein RFI_17539 [Reticulomyxa filosa]|uniref:Vps52 C-terminal domain-containing protein n=1 Tax=Reticulomyxa filosa TaxID=46433 RepID=X6N083_RETFI|nr:hypothetical protein RFI_17539 [Reticulomyxa filosa]|eukprot:ETO19690.1 hypothetical protein RFI_17539 [Reticulomyxa filosa]
MVERKVPCLEQFFDKLIINYWARFKAIFEENVRSVDALEPSVKKMTSYVSKGTCPPHFVTIRFATYSCGILLLNEDKQQAILNECVRQLQSCWEKLLSRFSQKIENEKTRTVFLIINYSVVISAFSAQSLQKFAMYKQISDALQRFEDDYIEMELKEHFTRWIGFVATTETKLQQEPLSKVDMSHVLSIVKNFYETWQRELSSAVKNVQDYFTPNISAASAQEVGNEELFKISKDVLKRMLSQILVYHSRFVKLIERLMTQQGKDNDILRFVVPEHVIRGEMRSYWNKD